jgi:predicted nucleic acid-binding Zn ribbon protein
MTLYRRSPRPVSGALSSLRDEWSPVTLLAAVQQSWREVVGDAIADEASPVAERAGVVTVSCSSAAWAQELDLLGPAILERLNASVGDRRVARLRCTSGR